VACECHRVFCGILGYSRPLNACAHQRDPEKAPTGFKPRLLSYHACLCDARFDRYAIAKRNIKRIFHMCVGRPYPTDCIEIGPFVKVINIVNRANFDGCMLRDLASAKGRIKALPTGSCYGHYNNALRYRAGM
jgi:hypothetical protein